ncbi:lysophospholipid acyltransferase family protein [Endozoicomonas gorgoniicola]|uniref:Lysophospholipid acyltransferase family protein n=1 Tax=Endozoicomonas gorgoniicola TaxID=1234144 RepID=A0ABT3N3H4_9GAMM|nr:lysophospholipid acyltransferase family protein [Endozoicomonas gorgoniicola]MCW7556180.1 lysophospholipid acyltransferase family protein [Endozoicomonas gorgoniicola]
MRRTIFDTPVINTALRLLSNAILKLRGWKKEGQLPDVGKCVVIAAPHTSNWDFVFMMLMAFSFRLKVFWMGKNSLFKGPLGLIMRFLGGIPVERSKHTGLVQQTIDQFNQNDDLFIALSPEGTRGKVTKWKSGFYHVANGANVPVAMAFLDYKRKVAGFGPLFMPTGDYEKDLTDIQAFYRGISGKNPSQF